ncbi:hypothetical protein TRVL_09235 [Trypanosoma vivax]|nr:hypothetical protein TRVL_09235 [Trypanosoma vivax]
MRLQSCCCRVIFSSITHMPPCFHACCFVPCSFQVLPLQTNSRFVLVCVLSANPYCCLRVLCWANVPLSVCVVPFTTLTLSVARPRCKCFMHWRQHALWTAHARFCQLLE